MAGPGAYLVPDREIIPERTEKLPTSFAVCANREGIRSSVPPKRM